MSVCEDIFTEMHSNNQIFTQRGGENILLYNLIQNRICDKYQIMAQCYRNASNWYIMINGVMIDIYLSFVIIYISRAAMQLQIDVSG